MNRFWKEHMCEVSTFGIVYVLMLFSSSSWLLHQKTEISLSYGWHAWKELYKSMMILAFIPAILVTLFVSRLHRGYLKEAVNRVMYLIRYVCIVLLLSVISALFVLQLSNVYATMGGNVEYLSWISFFLFWCMVCWMKLAIKLTSWLVHDRNARIVLILTAILISLLTYQTMWEWIEQYMKKWCLFIHLPYERKHTDCLMVSLGSIPLFVKFWHQVGRFFNLD